MGNTNQTGRGSNDISTSAMKGYPILFHEIHSDNIQISHDKRKAKRIESFCKGISFSNRPIAINERVYLKFSEVSTSWSGVVRFGFSSHDPATLTSSELPRYACPDLTNKPGFWAKALPERYAKEANTLFFYYSRNGDVMFGLNGEEKGVFFSGVNTSGLLWGILDIYGNTTSMEFIGDSECETVWYRQAPKISAASAVRKSLRRQSAPPLDDPPGGCSIPPGLLTDNFAIAADGRQLNNLSPSSGILPPLPPPETASLNKSLTHTSAASNGTQSLGGNIPVRFHTHVSFTPMPFHPTTGRNICLSSDKTIAVRLVEEYCNGYIFTHRPVRCGEKLVLQVLAVDKAFVGGLAFGMTAADPYGLNPDEFPDDSDNLLDRPEYWVVNKDVCGNAEIGDELSFQLTEDGEVRYGRNGHHITTLMHVDKTLPLWAFFDVYGSTQKVKSLGVASRAAPPVPTHRGSVSSLSGSLTVALPPPRSAATTPTNITPPPRPPPPRSSPSSRRGSGASPVPPTLPPKQHRPLPAQPPPPGSILTPTPVGGALASSQGSLTSLTPSPTPRTPTTPMQPSPAPVQPSPPQIPPHSSQVNKPGPPIPVRTIPAPPPPPSTIPSRPPPAPPTSMEDETDEAADNASNECSVCFEQAVDCVLYTCGHMCLCFECATDIKKQPSPLCPICRQEIKDIIKIFRS